MRIVILGAGGMLGTDLVRSRPAGHEVTGFSRADLDIRDAGALDRAIRSIRPDWIINAAGHTNVDDTERHSRPAFEVNVDAVAGLAEIGARYGATILHFSTDYVFDGTKPGFYSEDDPPNPINEYGRSKLQSERVLERSAARYLIVRTQWLFGLHGHSFVNLMHERASTRQRTRAVRDETGCCTYTLDLADAVWPLVERGVTGMTLHVANRGAASRYEIARKVFERLGAGACLTACTRAEYESATPRPANSALSIVRVEAILGRAMPFWGDAVDRFLLERARLTPSR